MKKLKLQELNRLTEEEFKITQKHSIIIFLDNIRSMHNVGSTFRTADAFLCEKIILGGITALPPHREIHKTALGAENTVKWEHAPDCINKVNELRTEGYKIISVEQVKGSTSLENLKMDSSDKVCLIFGNEVFGVDDKLIELSDICLEIPQFGTKHSLNISVSLGIVTWEVVKKMI